MAPSILQVLQRWLWAACIAIGVGCGADREDGVGSIGQAPESTASGVEVANGDASALHTVEVLSPVFHVTRKFRSMEGPLHGQPVSLAQPARPELLWITGYRASVVGPAGEDGVSQEFMCHNNLDFNLARHATEFGWSQTASARMFTISQGQFAVALPDGFGIPVKSNEQLNLGTQILNHNLENPNLDVRHKVEIDYIRDADLEKPLKPLYQAHPYILASLGEVEAYFGVQDPTAVHEGASCSPGTVPQQAVNDAVYRDEFGGRFTGHWVLKPGTEVRHTLVTKLLDLTFDTRIHFIGAHLHPFAKSLELRDLTTGKSVWTAHARGPEQGVGLAEVDTFASAEGLPLYKSHEYELVSVYDNTSGVDQDAMATLFLYLYDADGAKSIEYLRRRARWAAGSN